MCPLIYAHPGYLVLNVRKKYEHPRVCISAVLGVEIISIKEFIFISVDSKIIPGTIQSVRSAYKFTQV